MNGVGEFIRKHALILQAKGVQNYSARLFSIRLAISVLWLTIGLLMVVGNRWDELGKTWESRNVLVTGGRIRGKRGRRF